LIETIAGRVEKIVSRGLVVNVYGIGLFVQVPDPLKFTKDELVSLLIYWIWSAEKGPLLFGFRSESERSVFGLLLECPKIGPQISLQALAQITAQKLLQILTLGDEHALSSLNGIGPKKAKTMVSELQDKASKVLSELKPEEKNSVQGSRILEEVCAALKAMGYSTVEISTAMNGVDANLIKQTSDFSGLTRLMLSQLLKQKSM
jgi:Holliday junction DNA helicase RuvA